MNVDVVLSTDERRCDVVNWWMSTWSCQL